MRFKFDVEQPRRVLGALKIPAHQHRLSATRDSIGSPSLAKHPSIFAATTLRRIHNQVSCKNLGAPLPAPCLGTLRASSSLEPAHMGNASAKNLCQRGHEVFKSLLKGRLILDVRFPTLLNRDPI